MRASLLPLLLLLPLGAGAAPRMTVDDLLAVKWVKQPALSPDGKRVAFVVSTADKARNKRRSSIYLYDLRGGRLRRLTNAAAGSSHSPVFAPDSRTVAFISSRGKGKPQIWTIRVDGGEACRLTRLATGAGGPLVYSPDGKLIAFTASVFPGCRDDACNRKKLDAKKRSKVKARLFDRLMIRHWNEWLDERRTHVLVAPASGKGKTRDLTPGPHHAPPLALGGHLDVVFSPDGKTLAFASNTDPSPATSTNNDIFEVAVAGGRPRRVSSSKGNDTDPAYSPDGRWLAFLSMARAGYESDRPRVMVRDRRSGKTEEWSKGYDGRPLQLVWGPGSKVLYFNAPDRGRLEIFAASATGVRRVTRGRYARDLSVTPEGRLVYTDEAADRPAELAVEGSDGKGYRRLTHLNDWLRRKLGWLGAEHLWFKGAGGEKVHAILIKPPGFRGGRRYPAMVMIHGGPQGMTGDSFHPRWNLQMFASPGYVIFGINFHGSTGFGQRFQDSIRGDWGGKPYRDIVEGTEHLARLPFVRAKKICAAGASYGGYMVNWVATQTRRFNCLISHAGLFNMESKYGSTEELWFPEWDWRGTPWTQRALYRRFSPHSHAEKIRTPTLVIHGQRDYRVPVEQGFQMFTVLQRQGIPSRLLYFPDEDHFVAKPQNVQLWWDTMLDWLGRYLR